MLSGRFNQLNIITNNFNVLSLAISICATWQVLCTMFVMGMVHRLQVNVLVIHHILLVVTAIHLQLHSSFLFSLHHPHGMIVHLYLLTVMALHIHLVLLHLFATHLLIHHHVSLLLLIALHCLLCGVVLLIILSVSLSGLRVGLQSSHHHFFGICSSLSLLLCVLLITLSQDAKVLSVTSSVSRNFILKTINLFL